MEDGNVEGKASLDAKEEESEDSEGTVSNDWKKEESEYIKKRRFIKYVHKYDKESSIYNEFMSFKKQKTNESHKTNRKSEGIEILRKLPHDIPYKYLRKIYQIGDDKIKYVRDRSKAVPLRKIREKKIPVLTEKKKEFNDFLSVYQIQDLLEIKVQNLFISYANYCESKNVSIEGRYTERTFFYEVSKYKTKSVTFSAEEVIRKGDDFELLPITVDNANSNEL